jgi:SOS regulatory protein LexA
MRVPCTKTGKSYPIIERMFYNRNIRTADDRTYLARLQDYYACHRVLPSYAVIGALLGLRSKSSVAALVDRFKRQGYLQATPERRLTPGRRFFERPWAESYVKAGFPSPAEEALRDTLTIDEYLIERPSQTVLITVKGDSMVDAGIHPGDIAVVERRITADPGELVVAIVDNELTLKYLDRDESGFFLRPANHSYPPICPQGELQIFGVVVGLIRKYR